MTNEPTIKTDEQVREEFEKKFCVKDDSDWDMYGAHPDYFDSWEDSIQPSEVIKFFLELRRKEHEAMRSMVEGMKKELPENPKFADGLAKNMMDSIAFSVHNNALDKVLSEVIPKGDE